ncbi:MAG TPA: hypothetical protein VJ756_05810 [Terriglobales bacterium]|nr:hypothetical protein [Terriglobales bacterium]
MKTKRSNHHENVVCCILGLLLLTILAWPQKGTATTEKAVTALEQQWLRRNKRATLTCSSLFWLTANGSVLPATHH